MIYLDHSTTSPCPPAVVEAMLPYFSQRAGSPAAVHGAGRAARQGVDAARRQVAALVGVHESQVIFTSSGTEANNLALFGVAARAGYRGHLVLSAVEHPSLLMAAAMLEQRGMGITRVGVNGAGRVEPEAVAAAITPQTLLVSLQHANDETGVLQPLAQVAALCQARGVPLHCDAVQSAGRLPLAMNALPVAMMTLSAHKMGGPKGVGALVVAKGVALDPLLVGGGQERGRRAGMENLPGLVGFGAAAVLAQAEMATESPRLLALREALEHGVLERLPGARILGAEVPRLPHVTALALPGVDGETLVMNLDLAGVAISSGSGCASGRHEPSHVTRAMGLPVALQGGVVRFGVGRGNTLEEIQHLLALLPPMVQRLCATQALLLE